MAGRLIRSVALVAMWMSLGWALTRTGIRNVTPCYLVLGVPLTIVWQRFVKREPLRALWVKDVSREPPSRTRRGIMTVLATGAAIFPIVSVVKALSAHAFAQAIWALCAVFGAVGFGFAASRMRRIDVVSLAGAMMTSGAVGSLVVVFTFLAKTRVQHLPAPETSAALGDGIKSFALYLPITFVLEEVTFRSLIDDDVADARRWQGLATAIASSMLWGLWHLPIIPALSLGVVAYVTVLHTVIGVPLALWYRRSGNLLAPAMTHAFIDSLRDALIG